MILTVTIPDATDDAYDQVQAALEAAGIDTFRIQLQTEEQYEATHTLPAWP